MARSYHQGHYDFPYGNREKCKNTNPPTYRSSWELHVMNYFSRSPRIIEWVSEVPIPYLSEVKGRMSRYYIDFIVKYRDSNGEIVTELIEVKPQNQTTPPKKGKGKKSEQTYIQESLTYMNNQEKWCAAQKWAEERGWKFRILTENQIFRG